MFDEFEPIGTRTTPDLLALLIAQYANVHRREGARALLPQDILADPLLPERLTPQQEAHRANSIAADYRRLRAERLANMERDNPKPNEE